MIAPTRASWLAFLSLASAWAAAVAGLAVLPLSAAAFAIAPSAGTPAAASLVAWLGVAVELPVRRTCERCGGRGEAWDEPCVPCGGAGHTEERRDITIALPRGLADGDRLLVRLGGRHVVPTAVTLHVTLT